MHLSRQIFIPALALLLLSVPRASLSAVTVRNEKTTFGDKEVATVVLENAFVTLRIVPERGGRIADWIDRRQGDANVLSLPRDAERSGYGGLLDDHGWVGSVTGLGDFYNHTFEWTLLRETPEEVVLELRPRDVTHYRRTLTLRADSPLIRIDYYFSNDTQEDSANILIRNVVWPSGGPNPDDHLYSTPLTSGVRIDGRLVGRNAAVSAPWRAIGSVAHKRLVAFAFADDLFEGAYDWEGSVTRPSFEWYYRPIPAGHQAHTTLWAYLAHGFSRAAHVSERLVADLEMERGGDGVAIKWALAAMDGKLKQASIATVVTDLSGKDLARLPEVVLDNLELDVRREGRLLWAGGAPQAVVVRQTVSSGGEVVAEYEQPFELGRESYTRAVTRRGAAPMTAITGWKPQPPLEVRASERDRGRGFVIYSGEGEQRGASLDAVELTLGGDEYESLELRFKALTGLGTNVVLSVKHPEGMPETTLAVTAAEHLFIAKIWGKDRYGWKLNETNSFVPDPANDARFWLIAHSGDLEPGSYPLEVHLTPEKGEAGKLAVVLHVLPVRLPEDRHYFLEANSHFNQLGQDPKIRGGGKRWEWNIAGAEAYADDFHAHGGRMVTAYAYSTAPGASYAAMNLRESGEPLMEALKIDAAWLNGEGPLPALDLSFWDPWLQIWFERGFTRYRTTLGGVDSYWKMHQSFIKRYEVQDPQRGRRWLLGETARYLKEKGFRHVYATIDDEIAPDKFDAWMKAAKDARENGWSPGVTISPGFFRNQELYHKAGPVMDYWVIGNPIGEQIRQARLDGCIVPGNSVGSYDGWGTRFREYSHMRAARWSDALAEMEVFWIQCYIRNFGESIVFNENGHPYSSASWEGVRDGCEDGNYLKAATAMIGQLRERAPQQAEGFAGRLKELHAGIDKDDAATIRAAKKGLLNLLLDLRRVVPPGKPSLLWEELPIVADGVAQFTLAALPGGQAAARRFADVVQQKTGVVIPVTGLTGSSELAPRTILFGHPADADWPIEQAGTAAELGVSATYPAGASYIVVERQRQDRHLIMILGRDAGLQLGAGNFGRMLKLNVGFAGQYYRERNTP